MLFIVYHSKRPLRVCVSHSLSLLSAVNPSLNHQLLTAVQQSLVFSRYLVHLLRYALFYPHTLPFESRSTDADMGHC